MSDTSSLTELARFAGRSPLADRRPERRRAAVLAYAGLDGRPRGRRIADLLGTVMTLSARTRRMVAPRVEIDLDVFAPGGERAVRLAVGKR